MKQLTSKYEESKKLYLEIHCIEKEFRELKHEVIALSWKQKRQELEIIKLMGKITGLKFNIKMSIITFIIIPGITIAELFIAYKVF